MRIAIVAQMVATTLAALPLLAAWHARAETPRVAAPVTHENVAIYLLKGRSAEGPVPLTLAEALEKGFIDVYETGNVQELQIENKGSEPVFVQLGDIVKGGRQDRVLTVSLVLEPKSGRVPIGAFCVEQGRWSARGGEDAKKFAASDAMLPSREAKVAIAKPTARVAPPAEANAEPRRARTPIEAELEARQLRQSVDDLMRRADGEALIGGRPRPSADSQGEVWRNVDALQRQLSASLAAPVASERSRTSLQLSLENDKLKAAQAGYVAALEPAGLRDDDVIGIAVAIGGRIVSAEQYPSNGLFRKMWPKLVRAAATEAIALKDKTAAATVPAPAPEAVVSFLAEADRGATSERALGSIAKVETREAERTLSVTAQAPRGGFLHRSYLAK